MIERPFTVREGDAILAAHPGSADELTLSYHLDYGPDSAIGSQSFLVDVAPETFRSELAASRTFLLEAEARRSAGRGHRHAGHRGRRPDLRTRRRHRQHAPLSATSAPGTRSSTWSATWRSWAWTCTASWSRTARATTPTPRWCGSCSRAVEKEKESGPRVPPIPLQQDGTIDIQGIMEILPHRYPFLLVDRVLELEPGRRVVALKNVSVNEPFFQGHWPGRPIMPGVLIVEAMAQAGGVLIAASVDAIGQGRADRLDRRRQAPPAGRPRRPAPARGHRPNGSSRTPPPSPRSPGWATRVAAEAKIRFVMVDAHVAA